MSYFRKATRQIANPTYIETGSIYHVKSEFFSKHKIRNKEYSNVLITEEIENIDIDSYIDLELSKVYVEDYKVNGVTSIFNIFPAEI